MEAFLPIQRLCPPPPPPQDMGLHENIPKLVGEFISAQFSNLKIRDLV